VLFALFSQSRGISLANLEIGSTAVSLRSAPEVQPAGLGQLER
jgi:hypothetical protein